MARLLLPHYSHSEREGRALLREAFNLSGYQQIVGTELQVRLSKPLAALCTELNDTETHYPGTDLTLVHSVKQGLIHT